MEKKNYKNLLGIIVIIFPFVHWLYLQIKWGVGYVPVELYAVDYVMKTLCIITGILILTRKDVIKTEE